MTKTEAQDFESRKVSTGPPIFGSLVRMLVGVGVILRHEPTCWPRLKTGF